MQGGYFIYNTVSFTQLTPLRDRRTTPTSSYITMGGEIGPDSYYLEDMPQLTGSDGHYVAVFSPPASTTGLPDGSTLLVSYAYPVDAQGNVVLQPAGNPSEPGPGTLQPEIKIALANLKHVLASCSA